MFGDKLHSNQLSWVIGAIAACWFLILVMTHVSYFFNGVNAALRTYQADLKGQQKCLTDTDHRITFRQRCEELDALNYFTPFWKGWESVSKNTYLSSFGAFDLFSYAIKSVGIPLLLIGVALFVLGIYLHTMLNKLTQQTNQLTGKNGAPPGMLALDIVSAEAWQRFAQLQNAVGMAPAVASSTRQDRLQWHTGEREYEEVDH